MAPARRKKKKKAAKKPAPGTTKKLAAESDTSSRKTGEEPKPIVRRREWIAMAVIAVATAATWARGVGGDLLVSWDDERFITDNDQVQHPSVDALVSFFTEQHMEAYHPLHMLSYWLDVPWFGVDATVIHVVSLLLWIGVLLLVFRVMRRLELAVPIAVLATLAYGLHPTQVEVVTWASGRKDILAALFSCLTVLAHLKSTKLTDKHAWLSRAFYLLGALSKTTILPLPGVLFLIDVFLRRKKWKDALIAQVPTVLIGLVLSFVVLSIWDTHEMTRPDAAGGTFGGRVMLVLSTVTHHLWMAVVPLGNSPVYPIFRDANLPAIAAIGPLVVAIGAYSAHRFGARRALVAILGFLVLLLPVMNFVPMYWHYMDRYLSLPLLPLAFGFGAAVAWLAARTGDGRTPLIAGGIVVALLAVRTVDHQGAYTDDMTLWEHATETEPESFYAWMKLGEVQREAGEYDEAIASYTKAIDIAPQLRLGHTAHFVAYAMKDEERLGLEPQAMELASRYITILDDVPGLRTLAGDMATTGYRDAALIPLARSLEIEPLPDERLMQAAAVQRTNGNEWLAEFYEGRMSGPAPTTIRSRPE